jgi:periplasmic mercuric ion binding protein
MTISKKLTGFLVLLLIIASQAAMAQKSKPIKTLVVKTTIYCDHCKVCESCGGRILKELYNEKGIKNTSVDPKANTITVIYDEKKISAGEIKQKITSLGFDADELKADPAAVARLDDCCKKPE